MRILRFFVLIILAITALAAAFAADSSTELRKKQADELKGFYQDEAKAKAEQKDTQAKERDALLKRHREARAAFLQEKHSAPERAEFFAKEREEMQTLRARQKDERKQFESSLKTKAKEFHTAQKLQVQ